MYEILSGVTECEMCYFITFYYGLSMVCLFKNNLLYFIQHTISEPSQQKYLYYKLMNKHFVTDF